MAFWKEEGGKRLELELKVEREIARSSAKEIWKRFQNSWRLRKNGRQVGKVLVEVLIIRRRQTEEKGKLFVKSNEGKIRQREFYS